MQTRRGFLKIAGMAATATSLPVLVSASGKPRAATASRLVTWGITDRFTWLNGAKWARPDGKPQRSLPLDADYQPTPAFFALRDAIDTRKAKA